MARRAAASFKPEALPPRAGGAGARSAGAALCTPGARRGVGRGVSGPGAGLSGGAPAWVPRGRRLPERSPGGVGRAGRAGQPVPYVFVPQVHLKLPSEVWGRGVPAVAEREALLLGLGQLF